MNAWARVMSIAMGLAQAATAMAADGSWQLVEGQSVELPRETVLKVMRLEDERCRPVEHCAAADAAARVAAAEIELTQHGRRYHPGALALPASEVNVAHAKVGDWLIELADIAPAGRALPADGPDRVQRATLRLTQADRVAVNLGEAAPLPLAGFSLRVVAIEDSRCPLGVACATAGSVRVIAEASRGGAVERLAFGGPGGESALTWQGHDIQLCDVQPRLRVGEVPGGQRADFFVNPARGPLTDSDVNGMSCTRSLVSR
jgi:hypothetical protein